MSIHPYTRLGRGNDLAELESSPHGFTLDPDVLQTVAMASFEAGNTDMSTPSSAIRCQATIRSTPGIVISRVICGLKAIAQCWVPARERPLVSLRRSSRRSIACSRAESASEPASQPFPPPSATVVTHNPAAKSPATPSCEVPGASAASAANLDIVSNGVYSQISFPVSDFRGDASSERQWWSR